MYRGKISKYVFLLSAVIVGSLFWRCVEVPTNAPELPLYLQDNQIRFVNALSELKTTMNEEDPVTIDALPPDTMVLSISAIDTTFLYDTTEVEVADTATYSGYFLIDSLYHDTVAVEISDGEVDTTYFDEWYTYRFITDTTVTAIDSTIDSTAYVPNGALQVIDRFFREDSAVVSSIDLSVGSGGTSVTGIGFGSASNYMANWPVGVNDLVLTAYSDSTKYRRITKRDSTLYALVVKDTTDFYGGIGADGFAESIKDSLTADTTVLMGIAYGSSAGDTLTDSLTVTFPSDRKATILLHAPKSDDSKITVYTDNYISSGPVDVDENADFALLRVINATTPSTSADVSVVAGSDTTALATGDDNLGFTNNSGYVKFENVGTKTLLADIDYQMFDTASEEYVDATASLAEQMTLEANTRYTAFIFQDGNTFSIAVMVDDE